jgi:hypothetical protein
VNRLININQLRNEMININQFRNGVYAVACLCVLRKLRSVLFARPGGEGDGPDAADDGKGDGPSGRGRFDDGGGDAEREGGRC